MLLKPMQIRSHSSWIQLVDNMFDLVSNQSKEVEKAVLGRVNFSLNLLTNALKFQVVSGILCQMNNDRSI